VAGPLGYFFFVVFVAGAVFFVGVPAFMPFSW